MKNTAFAGLSILPEFYMKKVIRIVILSVLAFCLFIACQNYTADIEDYLSYWSAGVSITEYRFEPQPQIYTEGMQYVPSKEAVTVTFTVHNSKNLNLKMPGDSEAPADIISFPYIPGASGKSGAAPQFGKDYTFEKISNTELKLSYTASFLKQYEWGKGDITPSIILYTTDGRVFKQNIPFKLKVNTPPPAIQKCIIGQTKTASSSETSYYVMCLPLPTTEMEEPCGNGLLHKDITGIEINGTSYPLSVNEAQHTFIKPEDTAFLDVTDVEKLEANADDIPSDWTLYFKTDVEVKPDSPKKEYTVKLKDKKGLYSEPVTVGTQGKIVTVTFNLAGGNISGNTHAITMTGVPGTPLTQPPNPTKDGYTFNGWTPVLSSSPTFPAADMTYTAQWTPKTYTVTFKVDGGHGALTGTHSGTPKTANGSTEQQFESVPHNSTINFTATPHLGYEVDHWTGATPESGNNKKASLTVQDNVTVTVKFKAVSGQSSAIEATSWEDLRTKVQSASDGTVIEIAKNLTYNIAAAGTNKSTITVKKNIIIKSKAGNTYTLNAGGKGADSEQSNDKSTGVFEVDDDKTLTLENLALTMAEKYAVYVDPNSSLKMKNVTIKDCKTNFNAAGIYFNKGTDLTLEHCTIEKCKGKGSQSSGGINIQEPKGMVSIKDTTIENCEATSANSTGGGIYLYNVKNTQCKLENVTVNNCSALRGGGIHAKAGTLTISGCSFTKNVASGSIANGGGGAIYSEGAEITIIGCTIGDNNTNGGNYAVQGGGIFVNPNAKCILKAGTKISGNTAMQIGSEGGNGGGIFVNRVSSGTTAGILTIEGAKTSHVIISGNTADFGGGLYSHGKADIKYVEIKENSVEHDGGGMFNAGTCTMDNVSIENNKASHRTSSAGNGGGIYSDKELMLKHTAVIGNTAKMYGGAIYIDDSVFNMSGSTVITVEQSGGATAPSKNDIYLTNTAFITLTGKLTAAEKIARITLNSAGGYKETRVVVKGGGGFSITADYKNKFTITDKLTNPKKWELDFTGSELKLKKK